MMKGISPLIAVIMLIAFTMIVAGILAGWATQFVTQSRSELQFCGRAQLLIERAFYDNGTNLITLSLFNTGTVPLDGFVAVLTYKNGTSVSALQEDFNISYKQIKPLALTTNEDLSQISVQSLQCTGARDQLDRYAIQGLGFQSF